jgi:hypothetical protein
MQSRDFCFWLQGFFELSGDPAAISADQTAIISRHLELVFRHEITPLAKEKPAPDVPAPEPAPPQPAPTPLPAPDRTEPTVPYQQPPMC